MVQEHSAGKEVFFDSYLMDITNTPSPHKSPQHKKIPSLAEQKCAHPHAEYPLVPSKIYSLEPIASLLLQVDRSASFPFSYKEFVSSPVGTMPVVTVSWHS